MLTVGITGQTGSGKSTFVKFLGLKTVDSDKVAKNVTKDPKVITDLCNAFGNDILRSDQTLDRKLLAFKAFANCETVKKLNSIMHPTIIKQIQKLLKFHELSGEKIVLLDAPQLYESGAEKLCQKVIAVIASEKLRKERIIKRDGLSDKDADQRLAIQKPDTFYIERADYIIVNDGKTDNLKFRAEQIKLELIKLSEE